MNTSILRHLAATCCAALVLTACPSDDTSTTTNAGSSETGDSDSDTDTVSDSVSVSVSDTTPTTTMDPDTTVGPETTDPTDTTTDATTTDATTTDATTTDATTTDATTTDATTGSTSDATTGSTSDATTGSTTDATTGSTGGTTGGADCPELDAGGDTPAIVAIDTTGAGDDFTGSCGGAGGSDVTVAFTAPAAGDYYVSTVRDATEVDTVVYVLDGGCDGAELSCNDDAGQGLLSSFNVVTLAAGQSITVVVDGFDGDADGVSELYIEFIPPAGDGGACCIDDSGVGGCDAGPIEACVCGFDSFCCDTEWDANCVAEAEGICSVTCGGVAACETIDITSDLDGTEPTFNRPTAGSVGGACGLSGLGTAVSFDVYDYLLTGPAPHDLTADMCAATAFDSVVFLYQAADGSDAPFDSADPCTNLILGSDDFCGAASSAFADTLIEGAVQIVVTSFDNGTTGNYSLNVSSTTCQ